MYVCTCVKSFHFWIPSVCTYLHHTICGAETKYRKEHSPQVLGGRKNFWMFRYKFLAAESHDELQLPALDYPETEGGITYYLHVVGKYYDLQCCVILHYVGIIISQWDYYLGESYSVISAKNRLYEVPNQNPWSSSNIDKFPWYYSEGSMLIREHMIHRMSASTWSQSNCYRTVDPSISDIWGMIQRGLNLILFTPSATNLYLNSP